MKFEVHKIKSFVYSLIKIIAAIIGPLTLVVFLCQALKPPSYTNDGQFAIGLVISALAGLILGTGILISNIFKATLPLILSGSLVVILCLFDSYSSASSRGFSIPDFISCAVEVERIVPMIFGVAFIVVGMTSRRKLHSE